MNTLADGLQALGTAALPTFWLPLLAWTAFVLAAMLLLRLWRAASPLTHYTARAALLPALPLGLLLAASTDASLLALWPRELAGVPAEPLGLLLLPELAPPAATPTPAWTLYHSLGLLTVGAAALALARLGRLAGHARTLHRFRKHLSATAPTALQRTTDALAVELGLRHPIQAVATTRPVVPITLGWRRPLVVVPAALLGDPAALRLALLHELIHIRRRDVLWQSIEQTVSAVFAINPLLGLLQRSIGAYREMVCDAEVVSQPQVSSKHYAALLYSFVSPRPAPTPLALSMASSEKQLKKRILAMKTHRTSTPLQARPRRVVYMLAGLMLLSIATLIVACTDIAGPDVDATEDARALSKATPNAEVFVVVDQMPELVGGLKGLQQAIRYPKIAKQAGVSGRVIVQFIVDEEGQVTEPQVVRGIGAGCDEEAVRALQTVQFKPGMQDGKPVKVKMSIPITFKLADGETSSAASGTMRMLDGSLTFSHPEMSKEAMEAFTRELYAELGDYRTQIAEAEQRLQGEGLSAAEQATLEETLQELRAQVKRHIEARYQELNDKAKNKPTE